MENLVPVYILEEELEELYKEINKLERELHPISINPLAICIASLLEKFSFVGKIVTNPISLFLIFWALIFLGLETQR